MARPALRTLARTRVDGRSAPRGPAPLVAPLRSFDRSDVALAGGKGANLAELLRLGLPVPDGFIVTTEAYAAALRSSGVEVPERVTGDDAASLRRRVESVSLPETVRAGVLEAYAALDGGAVAVRSSATAEDMPGAAFAGQQDTYLGVSGQSAVLDAVRRCWGSLWSERAVAYRSALAIPLGEVRIAVVVQRMVDAEVAGVLFTADPVSGDRDVVMVDAATGLGEAVVSGAVTPDHYVLDPRGRVRTWTPGRRQVLSDPSTEGRPAPADGRPTPLLPRSALRELAALGTDVAWHFGRPQDIEWARAGGRLWLLQARPMTALPPPPVRLNRLQRRLGSILTEYVPVRPYPIDMSTWVPYGPAGLMAQVLARFGIDNAFADFLHEEDGVVDRLVPPSPHPTLGIVRAPWRLATLAARHDHKRWTADRRFLEYQASVRTLAHQDLTVLPWPALIRVPRQALALVRPIADLRIDYLPRCGFALLRLLAVLTLLRQRALLGDLVSGARTRTRDFNDAVARLADLARDDPALLSAVTAQDVDGLARFPEFAARVADLLDEYGHRETASPLLVTPPTLGEAPDILLAMVKVLAARPPEPSGRAEEAMRRLLESPLLNGPRRRARLQRWVEDARAGVAFREDSHSAFLMPLPVLRRSLLEIGRRLTSAGLLDRPEDVFHLRLEELEDIAAPGRVSAPARQRLTSAVRARAARRHELAGVRLIDPHAIFPVRAGGDVLVAGTPASGGRATGRVTIVHDPAEFSRLDEGNVLVCPYTNPSWTPLFQRAAAVVVDVGGAASHAAIVAREYGIPAVMGTAVGTSVLTDGQLVTVDGDTGRVTDAVAPRRA